MKTAEEWIGDPSTRFIRIDLPDIRAIQADALRHAAEKLSRHSGDWQSVIADLQYAAKNLNHEKDRSSNPAP